MHLDRPGNLLSIWVLLNSMVEVLCVFKGCTVVNSEIAVAWSTMLPWHCFEMKMFERLLGKTQELHEYES